MPFFSVEFDSPMIAAVIADDDVRPCESSNVVCDPPEEPSEPTPPVQPVSNLPETVTAIENALKEAFAEMASQQATFQAKAADYAMEIVRVFLGSTDEIVEDRLRQNVARVFDCPDDFNTAKIFVHSSSRNGIETWLFEHESIKSLDGTVEIQVDDALEPGDCRVDFGQSGRLASLDEQLELVESRLKQAIRDEHSGVQA